MELSEDPRRRRDSPERPPAASEEAVADFFGNERKGGGAELLGGAHAPRARLSFADFEKETDAMLVDDERQSGAARVAARVRERREALQSAEKRRVNIYMRGDGADDGGGGDDDDGPSVGGALFSL